jgi:hypothetical protein
MGNDLREESLTSWSRSSQSSPGVPGAEPSRGSHPAVNLSPSQAGDAFQHARRRENAVRPPTLVTSLNIPRHQGPGPGLSTSYTSTPISTTALSSPFSRSQPHLPSPGGAIRGSSPMAQGRSNYNVPYNPQEWGPMASSSPRAGPIPYLQASNEVQTVQPLSLPRSSGP